MKMKMVERHIITRNNEKWKRMDELCFLSKNLYNAGLYEIKRYFRETGKFLRYNDLEKKFRSEENENYVAISPNTSQQILMLLDKNFKSYFELLKKWKKDKKSLENCPKPPKYKDKVKGRNLLIFTEYNSERYNPSGLCMNEY